MLIPDFCHFLTWKLNSSAKNWNMAQQTYFNGKTFNPKPWKKCEQQYSFKSSEQGFYNVQENVTHQIH